jgi:hypothetical protein
LVKEHDAIQVPSGFRYNSGENTEFETVDSLRVKISEELNKSNLLLVNGHR